MNVIKNKKIILVMVVAVISAIALGTMLYVFLAPQRSTLYVFKNNYDAGTVLEASMLTPVQASSHIVVAGSKNDTSSYFITSENYSSLIKNGDVLKLNVEKGQPLMKNMLSSTDNNEIEVRMEGTSVAVTIPVNSTTGVTSQIKPESHINIYCTYNSGGTYLILENMRVLSVSSSGDGISGLTVELNNEQAVKLIDAVNTGTVYCGLTIDEGYIYESSEETAN